MRGVVSLAAALALRAQFPGRNLIVFLAFCAIFMTLVLQGTTLGWLVQRLGVGEVVAAAPKAEEARARADIAEAALDAVKGHLGDAGSTEHTAAAAELVDEHELRSVRASVEDLQATTDRQQARRRLRLVALQAARDKLKEQTDHVETETHRALAEELDLEEQQIRGSLGVAAPDDDQSG